MIGSCCAEKQLTCPHIDVCFGSWQKSSAGSVGMATENTLNANYLIKRGTSKGEHAI